MFYFVRNLSSTRYGNQQYRTGISSTATSTFTIPSSLAFAEENGVVSSQDRSSATNHLKVYEKIWILGDSSILESTNDYIERAYHYDALGRIIQIVEISPWGDTQRTSYKFHYTVREGKKLERIAFEVFPTIRIAPKVVIEDEEMYNRIY